MTVFAISVLFKLHKLQTVLGYERKSQLEYVMSQLVTSIDYCYLEVTWLTE